MVSVRRLGVVVVTLLLGRVLALGVSPPAFAGAEKWISNSTTNRCLETGLG